MTASPYDKAFHDYTLQASAVSARHVVGILRTLLPIRSVLDVGCSRGAWLRAWCDSGVEDFLGIDEPFLDPGTLLIDRDHFKALDLTHPLRLDRTFDLVQCLEVAEHLPSNRAAGLIHDLASLSSLVLFSAAPPGQGGMHHINEQPYTYWRDLFAAQGFVLIDCLRPKLRGHTDIAPWYRYNTFLFVRRDHLAGFPSSLLAFEIPGDQPVPDVSPWMYRLRKGIIARLPSAWCQFLAERRWSDG